MRETGLVLLTATTRTCWGPRPDRSAACWTRWKTERKAAAAAPSMAAAEVAMSEPHCSSPYSSTSFRSRLFHNNVKVWVPTFRLWAIFLLYFNFRKAHYESYYHGPPICKMRSAFYYILLFIFTIAMYQNNQTVIARNQRGCLFIY